MAGVSEQTKLHRFSTKLDGKTFTILTPRPSLTTRFATNYFHETWHIISDVSGARFLSKLFWWVSHYSAPNTVIVIDDEFRVPNPFDADPSSPIAIFNADTTHLSRKATGDLRSAIRRKPRSEGTVRVSTHSFARPDEPTDQDLAHHRASWSDQWHLVDHVNGVLRVTAQRDALRWWAIWLHDLGNQWYRGVDYRYLETSTWGDRQVSAMVHDAVQLRATMYPGTEHRQLMSDERSALLRALPKDHADRSSTDDHSPTD